MTLAMLTTLVYLIATSEGPSAANLGILAILMIVAEHRDQVFGDETSMSGSIAVGICAVVVFRTDAPLLGAFACGLSASVYWPHIRRQAWAKVIANAGSIGFAALAAAIVVDRLPDTTAPGASVIALLPAVLAYWLVNSTLLATAMAVARGGRIVGGAIALIKSEAVMLVFALGGGACGLLFTEVGMWAGVSALVLELLLVDALVISRPRRSQIDRPAVAVIGGWTLLMIAAAGIAFMLTTELGPIAAVLIALLGASVVCLAASLLLIRRRLGEWDGALALGLASGDLPLAVLAASVGVAAALGGVAAGAVAATIAGLLLAVAMSWRRRRQHHTDGIEHEDDVVALAILELALADRAGRTPRP